MVELADGSQTQSGKQNAEYGISSWQREVTGLSTGVGFGLSNYPEMPDGFRHSKILPPELSVSSELMCVAVPMILMFEFTGVILLTDLHASRCGDSMSY